MILKNQALRVTMSDSLPIVEAYEYKGLCLPLHSGRLCLNSVHVEWNAFTIDIRQSEHSVTYALHRAGTEIHIRYSIAPGEDALEMAVEVPVPGDLMSIGFSEMPLLEAEGKDINTWRDVHRQTHWDTPDERRGGGRGLHGYEGMHACRIVDMIPDGCEMESMHACFFNGNACWFVQSNQLISPLLTRVYESARYPRRGGRMTIGITDFPLYVRGKRRDPLMVKVRFLSDINGDGRADECDYQLALARSFPDAHEMYTKKIWYKIKCMGFSKDGVKTTLGQVEEIVRAVHNATDGIPQIIYLVGWQHEGHDTGYPSLNRVNRFLGTPEDIRALSITLRDKYDATLSFHANLDDAYEDSADWDENLMCRDVDGTLMKWIDLPEIGMKTAYHICHTKDVESAQVFRRIDEMLKLIPVTETIHLDAFRITNDSWEADGSHIGTLEELECGVMPILDYFRSRGIDPSTEGINGMPIEGVGLFGAFWHNGFGIPYHRKLVGGGMVALNNWVWGRGASIDMDFMYDAGELNIEAGFQERSFLESADDVMDAIYLGTMLYRFYLQFELLEAREKVHHTMTGARRVMETRYSKGVSARMEQHGDRLLVRMGDVTVAEDYDRFIPLPEGLFAYSREGCERGFVLPEEYRGKTLRAQALSFGGMEEYKDFSVDGNEIHLKLAPRAPVKIMI